MTQPKPEESTRTLFGAFQHKGDVKYPRAGVRSVSDGRWLLTLWDGDRVLHVIDEPLFDDRKTAFDYGWLTIGACRASGADLNGYPV